MFTKCLEQIKNNSFVKDTGILTLGTIAAQAISMISMIVISRLYHPADFGLLAVFIAVSNIVATASTLRYETCVLLPTEENESIKIVHLSLFLLAIIGLLSAGVALLLPDKIRATLGVSALAGWLSIAILNSMGIALLAVGTAWLNRNRSYVKMAQLRIVQSTVGAVVGITLGIYGFSAGLLIAQIMSFATASALVAVSLSSLRPITNWQSLRDTARKYGSVPRLMLPTVLLDSITQQLPVVLITAWFGSQSAGHFSMAWGVLALPISLVGAAVGQVFTQRFAQIWPDLASARRILYNTWILLCLVGVFPCVAVMLFGPQLFSLILGVTWAESGRMAAILAPMLLAMLVSSPTSGTYLVMGMQRYSLFFGILVMIYRPLCLYFGLVNGQLHTGLFVLVVAEIAQIVLYQYLAVRRLRRTA